MLANIAFNVLKPIQYSRRGCSAARKMTSAITSGCTIGETGRGSSGICVRAQSNCGVLTAGSSIIVSAIALRACINSERNKSVKPRIACFAPQYAACRGIERYASADPTLMMVPRLRVRIWRNAAMVP